ncbi:BON domain-containing protein [Chitinophaga silvatica]|uniref:BON domain-containing protein n=1 Tax=Chitinophaga silvatica TaxID=2282649 RepID=A0A3E1Y484_9BACT|nr:BON domain-containing protein [Chitinophaga silvatica]RFS19495.1 BON domain-containing protein [Chitinophaga silvatica]
MNLRHLTTSIMAIGLFFMIACKSKPKDSEIMNTVSTAVQSIPGVTADVKDGVVTLSGTVSTDDEKMAAENAAKSVKDVKSVTNNIMVAPPAPPPTAPVAVTADDSLRMAVADVVKDFPGVKVDVNDGVLTVTGEEKASRWKTLKMALDALHPKKVDAKGLKVK